MSKIETQGREKVSWATARLLWCNCNTMVGMLFSTGMHTDRTMFWHSPAGISGWHKRQAGSRLAQVF